MTESVETREKRKDTRIDLLKREFDFCWESIKINYQTREVLTRFYILSISIIGASLSILAGLDPSKLDAESLQRLFVSILPKVFTIALVIIGAFSLTTVYRILTLRRFTQEYLRRLNLIRSRLLQENQKLTSLKPFEEYQFIFYLDKLDRKDLKNKERKAKESKFKRFLNGELAKEIFNGDMILVYSIIAVFILLLLVLWESISLANFPCGFLYVLLIFGLIWFFGIFYVYYKRGVEINAFKRMMNSPQQKK